MFTTSILTLAMCQVPYGPSLQCHLAPRWPAGYQQPVGPWFYQWAYAPTSPWNAAVAELRARGRVRSRDRYSLPPSTTATLQDLDANRAAIYDALRHAPPEQKAELRAQWLDARAELERARTQAAKELR